MLNARILIVKPAQPTVVQTVTTLSWLLTGNVLIAKKAIFIILKRFSELIANNVVNIL